MDINFALTLKETVWSTSRQTNRNTSELSLLKSGNGTAKGRRRRRNRDTTSELVPGHLTGSYRTFSAQHLFWRDIAKRRREWQTRGSTGSATLQSKWFATG